MTSKELKMAAIDRQTGNVGSAESWQRLKLSGPCSRNPVAGRPNGFQPTAERNAQRSGCGGRGGDAADADGFDACGLDVSLRQFLESLISLIDPDLAEIVRRTEILDQTAPVIAAEMNLDEETVISRLHAGRRILRNLVVLAFSPSFAINLDTEQIDDTN